MSHHSPTTEPLTADDFDELDAILDDLRAREPETPQWEFCEGFMAALLCCRRSIARAEYLDVLLGGGEDASGSFADRAQRERFLQLWDRRWQEVQLALDAPVESLDDEAAYHPEVLDVRGAIASLPAEEQDVLDDQPLPSFAQVWALGFMFAVENWPDEWAAPRDAEVSRWLDQCLQALVALTEDDTAEPEIAPFGDEGVPTVSGQRIDEFAEAIWAVYDLRRLWRSMGPRTTGVRRAEAPGRNDPCPCGSGKKYKKCHGAA